MTFVELVFRNQWLVNVSCLATQIIINSEPYYQTILSFNYPGQKVFDNIVGKGENAAKMWLVKNISYYDTRF